MRIGTLPPHFLAEIHVPVGTIDEAYDAVIDVLNEALGGAGYIFSGPNVSPDVVIERDGSELNACNSVRFGMRVRDMRDEDLF